MITMADCNELKKLIYKYLLPFILHTHTHTYIYIYIKIIIMQVGTVFLELLFFCPYKYQHLHQIA